MSSIAAIRVGEDAARSTRAETVEAVVAKQIEPGDRASIFAEVLRQIEGTSFESAYAVLTNRYLLLVSESPSGGFELSGSYSRSDCSVVNYKDQPDASRFVILRHGTEGGLVSLYFKAEWEEQSGAIVRSLWPKTPSVEAVEESEEAEAVDEVETPAAEEPATAQVAQTRAEVIDTFSFAQELAGLTEAWDESGKDEEY